jgi:hypothetical protein
MSNASKPRNGLIAESPYLKLEEFLSIVKIF